MILSQSDGDVFANKRKICLAETLAETCTVMIVLSPLLPLRAESNLLPSSNVQDFLIYHQLSRCVSWDRACHSKWKDCVASLKVQIAIRLRFVQ